MRVLIQRVKRSEVLIDGIEKRSIGLGLLVLVGIEEADHEEDMKWLAQKIQALRIFDDEHGVMNLDLMQVSGSVMLISQFTLHASTRKGNRPSYIRAARPEHSKPLYLKMGAFMEQELGLKLVMGNFGSHMEISLINDGPVSIWMDSKVKE
jgi:D-tyrosyl-tRNA(Tyr) deacylase